jgi:stress response protein YsnF
MKSPPSEGASPEAEHAAAATNVASIPVLVEQLLVDRQVEEAGALRVRIAVDEQPCDVRENALVERVNVERVARNVPVAGRREPWTDGETLVVPLYEEVSVVERRLMLKEEVRLTRHVETLPLQGATVLRSERAIVERRDGDGRWFAVDVPPSAPSTSLEPDNPAGMPASPAP